MDRTLEQHEREAARRARRRQELEDLAAVLGTGAGRRTLGRVLNLLEFGGQPSEGNRQCQAAAIVLFAKMKEASPAAARKILETVFMPEYGGI